MGQSFNKTSIFEYNYNKKLKFITLVILGAIIIIGIICYYYFSLRNLDNFFVNTINGIVNHVKFQITKFSLLGAFYTTAFGGLFFLPIPTEILFFAFLRAGVFPAALVFLYIFGLIVSFTINYKVGERLSEISKKMITPKRFYKFKVSVNKYGMAAVFAFNVLPLPAQPLAAVLGVFKYNKAKFYLAFILGQGIKFLVLALAYFYIL